MPADTVTFVIELLDANELGVAEETIVDALAEAQTQIPRSVVVELSEIASAIAMDYDVAEFLAPWTVE